MPGNFVLFIGTTLTKTSKGIKVYSMTASQVLLTGTSSSNYTIILTFFCNTQPRTALLLRTEMSTLRDDKMRPLFKEAIVTRLAVTQSTTKMLRKYFLIFAFWKLTNMYLNGYEKGWPLFCPFKPNW